MTLPRINNHNISQYLNEEDVVRQTIEQIMKDFAMFGIELTFSDNIENAYDDLHQQLTEQVERLYNQDYSKLLSILYQVDISKNELSRANEELPYYSYPQVIANQIIMRELKKVLTRHYFKMKS